MSIQFFDKKNRNYLLVLITTGLYFTGISFLLLLPRHFKLLGSTETEIGWLIGAGVIPVVILPPLVGRLLEKFSPKWLVLIGLTIATFTIPVMQLFQEISWPMYLLRIINSAGMSFVFVALFVISAKAFDGAQKAHGIAYFAVMAQIGNAAGSFIGALTYDHISVTAFFLLAPAFLVIAALVILGFESPNPAPIEAATVASTSRGKILLNRQLIGGFAILLALGGAFGMALQFVPVYLEVLYQNGTIAQPISSVYFLTTALIAIATTRMILTKHVLRENREYMQTALIAGLIVSVLAIMYIRGPVSSMIISFMFGLTYGMLYPAFNALVLVRAGKQQGQAAGIASMMYEIGFRGFGFVMGPVAHLLGYTTMYVSLAFLIAIAAFTFLCLEQDRNIWVPNWARQKA